MSARFERALYAALIIVVYFFAVVPNGVDYGWAWGWPGAGLGFPLALVGGLITFGAGATALALVAARPRHPRIAFVLRLVAVPVILVGPALVFGRFGGLARSEGRGLAARVRKVTPLDQLQAWAVTGLAGSKDVPLPEDIARTLPPHPEVVWREDHVSVRWYDRGVLVGSSNYRPGGEDFFHEEIRPGVYVYVAEH
ncbi:MAG TPA: hypothetical protein VFK70_01570 [Vicinamibacteria bacterium]|nr:hypothetical protein [Vicinamibacteria bacterium]